MLAKLALGAASVLLVLASFEIGLRILAPQPVVFLDFGEIYEYDPKTGHRPRPGAVHDAGRVRINSQGLRDVEVAARKRPDVFRIVVLGDSFTFGAGPLPNIYAKVLERLLRDTLPEPPQYEVIGAGVPGWGTDEELVWLESRGLDYDPDLVILGFYVGNDVTDNLVLGPTVPVAGKLVPRSEADYYQTAPGALLLAAKALLFRSHLYRLIYNRLRGLRAPPLEASLVSGNPETEFRENTSRMLDVYLGATALFVEPAPRSIEAGWAHTETLMLEMARLLETRSIPFVVFVIPLQVQVNPILQERIRQRLGAESFAELRIDLPQRRLAALGGRLGVPVVDVLPEFAAAGREQMLYHPDNAHWNVAGDQLAGELLFRALRDRGLLAAER